MRVNTGRTTGASASTMAALMLAVFTASVGFGVVLPLLPYWISAKAGSAQGWQLGKQTAAASLGVTVGSAAGGLLFIVAALRGASFVLIAGVTILGFLLSLRLPQLLVPQTRPTPQVLPLNP